MTFRGFSPDLQTVADLYTKLRSDYARVRADPNDSWAAYDFFVTADSLADWRWPDRASGSDRGAWRHTMVGAIVFHLASGAKHFEATDPRHRSVHDVDRAEIPTSVFGDGIPEALRPEDSSDPQLVVRLRGGRVFAAWELAALTLEVWRNELGESRLW